MKDIKFRGKGVESGEWVYGDLIVINGYSYILPQHRRYAVSLEQIYQKLVLVIASTVCRYTGLKDKNGKEIYEGDIVKGYWWDKGTQHRHIGTVTYVMNAFVVRGVKQYKGLDKELNPIYEVIGNIYEHPHLQQGIPSESVLTKYKEG